MPTILFITVGGSPAPIVTAIQSLNPDRVIFICSDGPRGSASQVIGEGTPCEVRRGAEVISKQPNIPTQLNLGSRFDPKTDLILLDNPDDLSEGYRLISEAVKAIRQNEAEGQLYADYTGGTKTMSLTLGLVALDYGLSLYLTTSATRKNLLRVERGESTERASIAAITVERILDRDLPKFLGDFNYAGAIATLRGLLQSTELPGDRKRYIRELLDICTGFEAWDRFDHLEAWNPISLYMGRVQEHGLALKRVLGSRKLVDAEFSPAKSIAGHGYELVEDLLRNAERRAQQQRYDDAISRIYRAMELLAQIRLKQAYAICTGDVDLAKLPEDLRERYAAERDPNSSKIQLPLWKSYTLLSELNDDRLGPVFTSHAKPLWNALKVRNESLFAHGFRSVTHDDYSGAGATLKNFIDTGLAAVTSGSKHPALPQLPTSLN